jgi:hypothetical protein
MPRLLNNVIPGSNSREPERKLMIIAS